MKQPCPQTHSLARILQPGAWVITAALAGCAQPSALENALGESVRQARASQSVAAPASRPDGQSFSTDGVIAVHGMTRYQQSWINPPAPVNVLNIQAGGAAAPAPTTMPR